MDGAIAKFLSMATDSGGTLTSVLRNRVPGWCPDLSNPNVQRYWDGTRWSAQRVWAMRGWQESSLSVKDLEGATSAKKRFLRKRRA